MKYIILQWALLLTFSQWACSTKDTKIDPSPGHSEPGTVIEDKADTPAKKLLEGTTDLINGLMSYDLPDTMKVKELAIVALSIGGLRDSLEIRKRLQTLTGRDEEGDLPQVEISIGRKMKASLIDPYAAIDPNFHIEIQGQEEQLVDLQNNKTTDWLWNVIPIRTGKFPLQLIVEVIVINDLGENRINIPVFREEVMVSTSSGKLIAQNQGEKSLGDPVIDWIFMIIGVAVLVLIPIGIYKIVKKYFKPKERKRPAKALSFYMPKEKIDALEAQIAEGDLEPVLETLEKYFEMHDDDLQEQIILHRANWKENNKNKSLNLIDHETYARTRDKINYALLQIMDLITDKEKEVVSK